MSMLGSYFGGVSKSGRRRCVPSAVVLWSETVRLDWRTSWFWVTHGGRRPSV